MSLSLLHVHPQNWRQIDEHTITLIVVLKKTLVKFFLVSLPALEGSNDPQDQFINSMPKRSSPLHTFTICSIGEHWHFGSRVSKKPIFFWAEATRGSRIWNLTNRDEDSRKKETAANLEIFWKHKFKWSPYPYIVHKETLLRGTSRNCSHVLVADIPEAVSPRCNCTTNSSQGAWNEALCGCSSLPFNMCNNHLGNSRPCTRRLNL